MAAFSISRHLTALTLLIFFFKSLAADPDSSFSFTQFDNGSKFESKIALYGDAKVVNGGYAVQLTAGRVMYKNPIKLVEGMSRKLVSFSTYFSFSMSTDNGDGLDFLMIPSGLNVSEFGNSSFGLSLGTGKSKFKVVAAKFNTIRDVNDGVVKNHVGIRVGNVVSAELSNASAYSLARSSGKIHAWIDYEAGSRRFEVRLSQDDSLRPVSPMLSYPIDLSKVWEDDEVFVGFSSSTGNSFRTCFLHSWSFKLRHFPNWMHSEPLDPKAFAKSTKTSAVQKRSDCFYRVLAAMIFGAACGALSAFTVLYLWTIFGNRRPVVPEEFAMQPTDYEYEKVKVVVDKAIEDGKK
ncbi:L-type lectin-domain containing receptor kinase VIII.2 [Morella rubra]|uniref:L-type lectin-domain containing receptor kinase VIII.2 n=1 Tax=Morella rubra TaxID=262757 RepID=A0A6A1WKN9_9ROSI|nr:L-type lectin-domain containing receptor kinase VIII.2 [Morella rubra]